MKFILGALVFILTLGLTVKTLANEAAEPAVCTPEKQEHCTAETNHSTASSADKKEEHKAGGHHDDKSSTMNSLFPQKTKNVAQSERPSTVKLLAPKFLAELKSAPVKLEWTSAENATAYHIQVATDPNFKWLVINEYWVRGTSYDASALTPGQRYYWRVASVKGENESMFTKSLFVNSAFSIEAK